MSETKMNVSLRIAKNTVNALKEMARGISFRQHKDVCFSDLIREAITEYLERKGKK